MIVGNATEALNAIWVTLETFRPSARNVRSLTVFEIVSPRFLKFMSFLVESRIS